MRLLVFLTAAIPLCAGMALANAQQGPQQRTIESMTMEALAEQRNAALNDLAITRAQLTMMQAELQKMKDDAVKKPAAPSLTPK